MSNHYKPINKKQKEQFYTHFMSLLPENLNFNTI